MRMTLMVIAAIGVVIAVAGLAGRNLPGTQALQSAPVVEHMMIAPKNGSANGEPSALRQAAIAVGGPPATAAPPANSSLYTPQIARQGKMTLYAGDVNDAVAKVSAIARNAHGDVLSLDATSAADSAPAAAQITLRIPANRFDDTMQAIGSAGKVRDRSITANDLSGDITDSSARLRNLRRTETDIRHIMDRSGTVTQVLDAENQLSQVREQIETLESSLKSMQARVVYSTIDVSVQAETSSAPVEPTPASQLVTAWAAALHALAQFTVGILAAALWLVVFLPYALLTAAIIWAVHRRLRTVPNSWHAR